MNVIVEDIPKEFWFSEGKVSFKEFSQKFLDYMNDLEDIDKVKKEMKDNSESFDYSVIRWNYV